MWLLYQNLQLCKDGYNYTLNQMYKRLVWSFKALYDGEEPTEDWDGNSIPGAVPGVKLMNGLWMAVWAIICDLDHVFKCYGMPNSNSNKPCGLCSWILVICPGGISGQMLSGFQESTPSKFGWMLGCK